MERGEKKWRVENGGGRAKEKVGEEQIHGRGGSRKLTPGCGRNTEWWQMLEAKQININFSTTALL